MKKVLVVLVFALTSNFIYAANSDQAAISIAAAVSIISANSFSATTLQYPTIYNDFTGTITTFGTTSLTQVPGGINGSNSAVTVHLGSGVVRYGVSVGNMTFTNNGNTYTGTCSLPDGTPRQTDSSGNDTFRVAGSMTISPAMSATGSFNSSATITFTTY